jgi:hypothetical protein
MFYWYVLSYVLRTSDHINHVVCLYDIQYVLMVCFESCSENICSCNHCIGLWIFSHIYCIGLWESGMSYWYVRWVMFWAHSFN